MIPTICHGSSSECQLAELQKKLIDIIKEEGKEKEKKKRKE
jgi:hypothetical protein